MRFIHIADCHLDGFKDPRLGEIGFQNFSYTVDVAIDNEVDFFIIAGDLFNTSLPRVDMLKRTVKELTRLQKKDIPVYIIPGSHDFSPNGKSMIDVLEAAYLVKNVMQGNVTEQNKLELEFTIDPKTQTHITGIIGRKGMLDKGFYKDLDTSKLQTDKKKIFLFHTAIEELKTKELEAMDAQEISFLPSGFDYYAGGHVHIVKRYEDRTYKNVVYPGPTFPNSFSELETLKNGTFVFYDDNLEEPVNIQKIPNREVLPIHINIGKTTPSQATEKILESIKTQDMTKKIVLLRIEGTISEGKTTDIDHKEISKACLDNGAFIVLKNTYKLVSDLLEDIVVEATDAEDVEATVIEEYLEKIPFPFSDEKQTIQDLLQILSLEQADGEKKTTFIERIISTTQERIEKNNTE